VESVDVIYYVWSTELITSDCYGQQIFQLDRALKDKRPECSRRDEKIILQHNKAMSCVTKSVKETIEVVNL